VSTGELLRFEGVSKRYLRGLQVLHILRDVSFQMQRGEIVGVLGPRGAGKTTLLEIAAGMETVEEGSVRFEGRELGTLSDGELSDLLACKIALAGKSGPLRGERMLDYVEMPLLMGADERDPQTRARAALERVGAEACADQEWDSLSDWERAVVEVAQAIAREPALLLIDDLTATLGFRETDELTALLRELSQESQMGILMTVSDANAMLHSDRIMNLSGGRLMQKPQSSDENVVHLSDRGAAPRHAEHGSIS
jgi:ABC-type cobalamin/Fe3+-siderophores transport system ATPase subunit